MTVLFSISPAFSQLQFFPLGDLPGGATTSAAYGVSADGNVVVGFASTASGTVAFRWTEVGGMVALPGLTGGSSTSAIAYAVSADGSVIVGGSSSASGPQACVWSNDIASGLGDLAGGAFDSTARDISDNGQVIVGHGTSASGREAFRWTGGIMSGLGDLAGGSFESEAHAVTPDGALVTGYGTPSTKRIFTWNAIDNMQDYYPSTSAWAHDISTGGNTLVGHVNATFIIPNIPTFHYRRAARWNGGVISIIGPEDTSGGSADSLFYGVTPDASLAVGTFRYSSPNFFAVSHDSFNGVRNLKSVLVTNGIDMTDWELTAATAISDDGSVIVGYGINPDGHQEAWVIKGYSLDLMLRWIGNNSHWPANGDLTAADDLWMNIDSKDQGVGVTGLVVYSTDKGTTWNTAPLTEGTPGPDYDHWYQNLGSFPAGTTIRYSLAVEDEEGNQIWDNNQGRDYYAVVSPGYIGPVEWIGNDGSNGTVAHSVSNVPLQSAPALLLTNIQNGVSHLLARELQPGYNYTVDTGISLDSWTNSASLQPAGTNASVTVSNAAETVFFRMKAAATSSFIVVTREVWPQDSGKTARLGYRLNGGDWQVAEMSYAGQVGNNDLWRRMVGPVTSGTTIEYFIEVISASNGGMSHYDNNDNNNYSYTVP